MSLNWISLMGAALGGRRELDGDAMRSNARRGDVDAARTQGKRLRRIVQQVPARGGCETVRENGKARECRSPGPAGILAAGKVSSRFPSFTVHPEFYCRPRAEGAEEAEKE